MQREPLVPDLGGAVWLLVLINCMANAGSGLTLPFLIVYLHNARGIPLGHAGLLLALIGAAGIAATPLAGALADRIGARRTFVAGELIFMAATAAFIPVADFVDALVPALACGFAGGLTWVGLYVMLGERAPSVRRNEAFGVSYALANVGIGIGALVGGFVVDVHSPNSFVPLFLGDAASNLLFAAVLLAMSDGPTEAVVSPAPGARKTAAPAMGYRQVLGDRALLAVLFVNTLLVTVATSQMTSGFPAWVTGPARSTPRVVGAAFAANTVALVLGQLLILRLIRRRRRTSAAAAGALVFGLAWLVALIGGHAGGGTAAAVALIATLAVFAIGESLVAPTLPALVNDLAPSTLRGRYNAVFTLSWQIGPVIGPALAGLMLGHGFGDEFLLALALVCLAVAASMRWLRRLVPTKADLVTPGALEARA
jgi:MFS family permease